MNNIEIHIRSKRFRDQRGPVLENLQLHAERGEFLCLVGPSGAGKSTLLNLIAGLDQDYQGSISLPAPPSLDPDRSKPGAPRVGFVFQEPRLMPWLTVLDNLLLVAEEGESARERARDLLRTVGLHDVDEAFPGQLSGGMQRRVALARAFVAKPGVLLLDEPFVSLDAPSADRLRETLMQLWERDKPTVVFVTHNLREALALADRVVFLSARPARVVKELPLDMPRPRHLEDPEIGNLRARLLLEHPELLKGNGGAQVSPAQHWREA